MAKEALETAGIAYKDYTVSSSNEIQTVVESMVGNVDCIYAPTDNMIAAGMTTVAMVANENKIPVICGEEGMVDAGGLATYGIDYYQLGYMAGEQAVDCLLYTSVTAVIQSSSASVGILQTLAINGMVNWQSAIFITLGQNIGTCVTALLSCIGTSRTAKRAAVIHLLFNVFGTVIFGFAMFFIFIANPAFASSTADSVGISLSLIHI